MFPVKTIKQYSDEIVKFDKYKNEDKPDVYFYGLIGEAMEFNEAIELLLEYAEDESLPVSLEDNLISEGGDWFWYFVRLSKELEIDYDEVYIKALRSIGMTTDKIFFELTLMILRFNRETGKILEALKKAKRDDDGIITPDRRKKIQERLEKSAIHFLRLCSFFRIDPMRMMNMNIVKLTDRLEKGTIGGSDDDGSRVV